VGGFVFHYAYYSAFMNWHFKMVGERKQIRLEVMAGLCLLVITFLSYLQVMHNDFLNLDDDIYITENPHVLQGLTKSGIVWAFGFTGIDYWHPLTWLSHMLDCQLFGLNPSGHHFTNLFLHIINTLLILVVLQKITGDFWKSWFVALLFALHPLHVESVAWVVARKDVLSTFFGLLTIWTYARYVEIPNSRRYLLCLSFFLLGLMTKPMLVTLPFVLFLLDFWPLGRIALPKVKHGRATPGRAIQFLKSMPHGVPAFLLIVEKLPFLVLSAASVYISSLLAQRLGIVISTGVVPMSLRIQNGLVSLVSYIGKLIWPKNMAVFYPYPNVVPIWQSVGALLLLGGVSFLVIRMCKERPYLGTGWLWYIGTLVPVMGFVQAGAWPKMADRYTYVPFIGLFIMVAWGIPDILRRWRYSRVALQTSLGLLIPLLAITIWFQVRHWRNSVTLYEHALSVTKENYLAHNNLGAALSKQGKIDEAISHFREALRISPRYAVAHYNLGLDLNIKGKHQEAMTHFLEALRINPGNYKAHYGLGVVLFEQGKVEEAVVHYKKAVHINPDYVDAYYNLGFVLESQGRRGEAEVKYKEVLRINPNHLMAHLNLGTILADQGRIEEAIAQYVEALRIKPDFVEAYINLGVVLAGQGKIEEAIGLYQEALRIRPRFYATHFFLGSAYLHLGDRYAAMNEYQVLKKVDPVLADRLLDKIEEQKLKRKGSPS
jgi:tetratricopeptide (TPR) repeat protein